MKLARHYKPSEMAVLRVCRVLSCGQVSGSEKSCWRICGSRGKYILMVSNARGNLRMNSLLVLFIGMIVQTPPQFEVASVKPVAFGPTRIEMPPTGRVNFTNASVKTLVRTAYRLENYQIIGGPDWLDVDRFDVQARPAEDYQP